MVNDRWCGRLLWMGGRKAQAWRGEKEGGGGVAWLAEGDGVGKERDERKDRTVGGRDRCGADALPVYKNGGAGGACWRRCVFETCGC